MVRIARPICVVVPDDDGSTSSLGQAEACLNLISQQVGLRDYLDFINVISLRIQRLHRANLACLQYEHLHEMERHTIVANGYSDDGFEGIVLEFERAIRDERSRVEKVHLYMRDLDELRGKLLDHCAVGSPYCDFFLKTYHSYDGWIRQAEEVVLAIESVIEVYESDLKFYAQGDN